MAQEDSNGGPNDDEPPAFIPCEPPIPVPEPIHEMLVYTPLHTTRTRYVHLSADAVREALGEPMGGMMRSAANTLLTTPCVFAFDQAFTVPQVAEKLGISVSQVLNHIADGTLQAVNVGRGAIRRDLRVLDEDVDAFVEHRKVAPTAPGWSAGQTKPKVARRGMRDAKKAVGQTDPSEPGSFAERRAAILKQRGERP